VRRVREKVFKVYEDWKGMDAIQLIFVLYEIAGLILSIVGTFYLLFSTKILKFEGIRFNDIATTVTDIDQKRFRIGFVLILLGFAFQIIPLVYQIIILLKN